MGSTTAVGVASPYLAPSPRACPPRVLSTISLPSRPFLLSPLLYAGARCGRRWLGQVRLSLGFNIGENTGFYLIAIYVLYYCAPRGNGGSTVESARGW